MSRESELLRNTGILVIGKFLPKLIGLITLPLLTALLTKAEYGSYDLVTTLVMLVMPAVTLQIQSAAFRFLIDCRKDTEKSTGIISCILAFIIPVTLLVGALMSLFFRGFGKETQLLVFLYFFLDTLNQTLGQISRGLGDNKAYSFSSILLSAVYAAVLVAFALMSRMALSVVLLALCLAQASSILYLFLKVRLPRYCSLSGVSPSRLRELLGYSWPMIPNNLSAWVLKLSDRLVITGFLGIEANAVYSAATKIPNLLSTAQAVVMMAWQENASLAVGDADADAYFSDMLARGYDLMFGCTCLLIGAAPLFFRLLIRGDYAESYAQIPVLILAMFFCVMSALLGGIYIAHKRTANVGVTTMVAAAVNFLIDLAFVRVIGIWAGSVSTLVAYMVLYYYRLFHCRSFQPLQIDLRKQLLLLGLMIALVLLSLQNRLVLNILIAGIAILVSAAANASLLRSACRRWKGLLRKRGGYKRDTSK